jgi:hypothetical protein
MGLFETGERMGKLTYRSLDPDNDIAAGSDCLVSGGKSDRSILGQSETGNGSEGRDESHDDDQMQAAKKSYGRRKKMEMKIS